MQEIYKHQNIEHCDNKGKAIQDSIKKRKNINSMRKRYKALFNSKRINACKCSECFINITQILYKLKREDENNIKNF